MVWNVILAVIAASSQVVTGWMGYKVTGKSMSPQKQKIYDGLFMLVAAVGVFAVGAIAYRSGRMERVHFLSTVENTVTTNLAPPFNFLKPDYPLDLNVHYVNVGNGAAINTARYGRSSIQMDTSNASVDAAVEQFESYFKSYNRGTSQVAKGGDGFFTAEGPILTGPEFDDITNYRRMVFVVGIIKFTDDFGTHVQHICKMSQPMHNTVEVWGSCYKWNDEE
jgi:hypothetical protein